MYADTDFWIALLKEDDWLGDNAEKILDRYSGELETSMSIFIELFLIEERYSFDRDQAINAILELAEYDGKEDALFQASNYRDAGLTTFDAFHAALAGESIISSDNAFDEIEIDRIELESN